MAVRGRADFSASAHSTHAQAVRRDPDERAPRPEDRLGTRSARRPVNRPRKPLEQARMTVRWAAEREDTPRFRHGRPTSRVPPAMSADEKTFPEGFTFGVATSSYQVEGGIENDWAEWERAGKLKDPHM